MRTLRTLLALAAMAWGPEARAVPFHGCSFFKPPLSAATMACASFNFEPGGCWLVRGPVSYPGVLYSGWMPEYFLEVTNRAGESAFNTLDAPGLKAQLLAATASWTAHGPIPDLQGHATSEDLPRNGSNMSFYFGRSIDVPYGQEVWRLNTIPDQAGGYLPTCFKGITEFVPETWADALDSGDRLLAESWAATEYFFTCPVTGAAGPTSPYVIPGTWPCARRITVPEQKAYTAAGPNLADPTRQCMGQLGGLFPRTGFTEGSHFTAAERIAWRTASLSEDVFKAGVGVQMGDKWQIVYPKADPMCFQPGSLDRPSPKLIPSPILELFPERLLQPGYDFQENPVSPYPNTEYVFAVWRFRSHCIEFAQWATAAAEVASFMPIRTGICSAIDAVTGAP